MMIAQSVPSESRSLFHLSKPFKRSLNGVLETIDNVQMRAFQGADLQMLDRFRGQPIALAQNVIARLSGLSVAEVQSLAREDFTPLADDVLWEVSEVCIEIGLPPDFFLHPGRALPNSH